jgi:hypothetical protein
VSNEDGARDQDAERAPRLNVVVWHSRVSYLLATGALVFAFVACLLTRHWVVAVIIVPFLIGFLAAGPGRLRGDTFRRARRSD